MGSVEGDMAPVATDMGDGDFKGELVGRKVVGERIGVDAQLEYTSEELDGKEVYGRHVRVVWAY